MPFRARSVDCGRRSSCCSIYLAGAAWLIKRAPSRRTTVLVVLGAAVMTPLLQFALLYMDHPDVKAPLFYRTVSASSGGYFNVGAVVTDIPDYLRHFVERMPTYPIHPQRHPPGLPWLFAVSRQLFEQSPDLTRSLNAVLRAYQCQNIDLMNLPDSAIASATAQMIVPVLLGWWCGRSMRWAAASLTKHSATRGLDLAVDS